MMRSRDDVWSSLTALSFGTASGALSLIVPFVLIRLGEPGMVIGIVVSVAGLSQLLTRFLIPPLMRVISDSLVVLLSAVLLTVSIALMLVTWTVALMITVQMLHGCVRALFWTGLQTHSVRSGEAATRGLANVNLFASIGLMAGPALFGVLAAAVDFRTAVMVLFVSAATAIACSLGLVRYPRFASGSGIISRAAWTGPTIVGSWMSAIAGAWRGLLDTFVPILLIAMFFSETTTSWLVAASSGSILFGILIATRIRTGQNRLLYLAAVGIIAAVMVMLPLGQDRWFLVMTLMIMGGTVSGVLQTYGAALAADSVAPDLKGEAITITGIFRSSAILGVPGIMTVLVGVLPLSVVFTVSGAGFLASSAGAIARRRKS